MNNGGYKWYSKEDVASWPENHKRCRGCDAILHFSEFHKQKQTLFGINNYCKACRHPRSVEHYKTISHEKLIVQRARSRANRSGIPFDITEEDIFIHDVCPVLGIKLSTPGGKIVDSTPSIDKIIPALGYVKGNVIIISNKANRIKSNATADEIRRVADWLDFTAF
jgi:hypothetical protein